MTLHSYLDSLRGHLSPKSGQYVFLASGLNSMVGLYLRTTVITTENDNIVGGHDD